MRMENCQFFYFTCRESALETTLSLLRPKWNVDIAIGRRPRSQGGTDGELIDTGRLGISSDIMRLYEKLVRRLYQVRPTCDAAAGPASGR